MSGADDDYRYRGAAYQGAPGAFSEDAARLLVDSDGPLLPCRALEDVFHALTAGRVRYAVVPIENSIAGAVPGVDELMKRYRVQAVGDVTIRIAQTLIGLPGARVERLQRVLSHPVALAQCSRFLSCHSNLDAVSTFDTAGAVAEILAIADPASAAIASERAAEQLGAAVLLREIQDCPDNFTRFVKLRRAKEKSTKHEGHEEEHALHALHGLCS